MLRLTIRRDGKQYHFPRVSCKTDVETVGGVEVSPMKVMGKPTNEAPRCTLLPDTDIFERTTFITRSLSSARVNC
jgi:hypothetical protein